MSIFKYYSNFLEKNKLKNDEYIISNFYKFVELENIEDLKINLINFLSNTNIKGTILLASEGLNCSLAGRDEEIKSLFEFLSEMNSFNDLKPKLSISKINPFLKMKVRLKKEIVTMGIKDINPKIDKGIYIDAQNWNNVIKDKDIILIDTRNKYETAIGTFKKAIKPQIKNFREFPEWFNKQILKNKISKKTKIAMFCTGGIRCEKSTSYLKKIGYDNVFQLKDGILKYLEVIPKKTTLWEGECFVFDNRVSVNHSLKIGNYKMCFACRMPISDLDQLHERYVKGLSCHNCYDKLTKKQKKRFKERQKQINLKKLLY